MSDLTTFRDHARRMATAAHRADCDGTGDVRRGRAIDVLSCPDHESHGPHPWVKWRLDWRCPGQCGGCMSATEAQLWERLAAEIDEHLAPVADDLALFSEAP